MAMSLKDVVFSKLTALWRKCILDSLTA